MQVKLTELEEIGLKLVCLAREGKLKSYRCSQCPPELQSSRNCDGLQEDASVFFHPLLGEFGSCPMKFVSNSIHSFLEQYDLYEKYPSSAPTYGKLNPRYWEAVKFYENFRAEIRQKKQPSKPTQEDTSNNMSKMRKLFGKGN